MKKGQARFDLFLAQLQTLLDKAAKQKNPALWLYQNNARTPLFMLEGLAKLYAGIHNKKKFIKIKAHFKLLEDAIGQIDYYDAFAKEFAGNKKIPATVVSYLQAQAREKIQSLNEILTEKDWIGSGKSRIEKIRKKLKKADWLDEPKDVEGIRDFYFSSINGILEFSNQKNFHFENVEKDVHELRRMLRWLSIYPQALKGCIQLSQAKKSPAYLSKYLTKAITGSPYNVMPDAGDLRYFLLLDKTRFYALSWMISELGNLKDSGLRLEVIKEALIQSGSTDEKAALIKARSFLGNRQLTEQQVLDQAEAILKTFCKEQNLESLVIGTARV
ncbi:MAG TPA: hypothetical protein PKM83_01985 [Ferruginibacter sp.]|nr:hypothetical protein [Ferruginibacter sp.]HNO98483.1 hypothetical protein [Ferruginibacter sp.]